MYKYPTQLPRPATFFTKLLAIIIITRYKWPLLSFVCAQDLAQGELAIFMWIQSWLTAKDEWYELFVHMVFYKSFSQSFPKPFLKSFSQFVLCSWWSALGNFPLSPPSSPTFFHILCNTCASNSGQGL
jgi:hypothetical protein